MIAAVNESRVVGQTIQRARACHRCGTFDGVTITWAVPLDQGGWESEWNQNVLCGACREFRTRQHLEPNSTIVKEKPKSHWRGNRVEINGLVFRDVDMAAIHFGKSKQTIYRWIYNGLARYIRSGKPARLDSASASP